MSSHVAGPSEEQPEFGRCHQAGTGQAILEVIGSKLSYALKWCKPNSDDGDDDTVDFKRVW